MTNIFRLLLGSYINNCQRWQLLLEDQKEQLAYEAALSFAQPKKFKTAQTPETGPFWQWSTNLSA